MPALRTSSALTAVPGVLLVAASFAVAAAPTYSKDVAPIFYNSCVTCHRPGTTAPMSLLAYKDARPWARAIREKVLAREMPPWNADPRWGKFKNDPHLSDKEINTIKEWADGGAPEGNPKDLPPAPATTEGWHIGEPDLVLAAEEITVPAEGVVPLQYFKLEHTFTKDTWIKAVEVSPGNRGVVHHASAYVMPPAGEKLKGKAGRPGGEEGLLAMPAWQFRERPQRTASPEKPTEAKMLEELAGTETLAEVGHGGPSEGFPKGTGKLIKAGSTLYLQVHYHPNGRVEKDRSRLGLVLLKQPPEREIREFPVVNMNFTVPAGADNYEVKAEATFLTNVHLWSLAPHMHLRGKDMKYTLLYPDGRSETLLFVNPYDFYTQRQYEFTEPLAIPKGSKVIVTAHMNNSAANKLLGPDDWKHDVDRGRWSTDEMMSGHVRFTVDDPTTVASKSSAPAAGTTPNNDPR